MASTIAAWSPTSLQLRLALNSANSKKYRPNFGWARLGPGKVGCVVHVNKRFFVAEEKGTTGLERKIDGRLRVGSDSTTVDDFSGWSESDKDPISEESERNKWLIGAIGAGVGGVLLLTGLTFAALSLNKQKTSRTKHQMVPLTAEHEVLLSSDERNDTGKEIISESDSLKQENENSVAHKDADKDYSSRDYSVTTDSDGGTSTRDTLNGSDAANIVSHQEDLQHELSSDDVKLGIAEANSRSLDLAESQNVSDSLVSSDSKDLVVAGTTSEESSVNVERIPSSYYDDNPQNANTEQIDEMLGLAGDERASPSINPSPGTDIGSSVLVNVSVNSKSNTNSEPGVLPRGHEDNILSPSSHQNLNLSGSPVSGKKMQDVGHLYGQFVSSSSPNVDDDGNGLDKVDKSSSYSPSSGIFFSAAGIPAPSEVTTSHQEVPGKVLVPAVVDQIQGQALAALQVLKVIEVDVQPGDLCTRREYARWLVSATSALSRNTISKVYPAMYIENVTELAFDDIFPDDPDFPSIQGLAEAGFIASKLSRRDMNSSSDNDQSPFYFFPGSPLSRQDLVSWKMAIEKKQLPVADRKVLHQVSGFIDVDKIHPDACPAIVADLSAGEQGIIGLAFGYTRLFQPDKLVTKAQAAIALSTGEASDIVNEELARIEAESAAEKAVSAHNALVAEVEKDINASFERELLIEKEKIAAVERMAEEAKQELKKLRAEREQDNIALIKERAIVESEMELLSRLRRELEDHLQSLMNNKVEISYEKEQIGKLREQTESENREIARLQYELEVERKALSMARSWAEDEAKRAREQARALEEARARWEKQGIKVVVDDDLREEASVGVTWLAVGKQFKVEETVDRAESLTEKLKIMVASVAGKSRDVINKIIQKIGILISNLKEWTQKAGQQSGELKDAALSNISSSAQGWQRSTQEFSLAAKEGAKRAVGDCREAVEKITQKFKA